MPKRTKNEKSSNFKDDLLNLADPKRAANYMRFFKTGKGDYGEGDKFLGITVPKQREVAKKYYKEMPLKDLEKTITSKFHEIRLTSLLILTYKFEKAEEKEKMEIYNFYIKNKKHINNWDLVDVTAPRIVGVYLLNKKRRILYKMARSNDLWEKRIAILATLALIKNKELDDTFKMSKMLLDDKHDLMHKAVGWMLREAGKIDQKRLEDFLRANIKKMPRTALRYSIERFPEKKRKAYLLL